MIRQVRKGRLKSLPGSEQKKKGSEADITKEPVISAWQRLPERTVFRGFRPFLRPNPPSKNTEPHRNLMAFKTELSERLEKKK